jgi:KDO2-lipid IV(A) lauroyltransferase
LPATGDDAADAIEITRRLNALMEEWIRQQPDEWMCANRRWEKSMHRALHPKKRKKKKKAAAG